MLWMSFFLTGYIFCHKLVKSVSSNITVSWTCLLWLCFIWLHATLWHKVGKCIWTEMNSCLKEERDRVYVFFVLFWKLIFFTLRDFDYSHLQMSLFSSNEWCFAWNGNNRNYDNEHHKETMLHWCSFHKYMHMNSLQQAYANIDRH